jgi:hypothetical protein
VTKLEEHISYRGWQNCLRLSNTVVELIIATEIGPRILHFGFIGGQNIFHLVPEENGKRGGSEWRIYGGHRLWHAPEEIPRTYSPDNDPVSYTYNAETIRITQAKEPGTGIVKEMEISLSPDKNEVTVLHRLINQNHLPQKLSPWAISVLRPGGLAIIPQEPYGEGNEYLLPARSLAIWSYTQMQDSRWTWGNKYILAKQDPSLNSEQKIGFLNKQGWGSYVSGNECFIIYFGYNPDAGYPDFSSNHEVYINGQFLELESLGAYNIIPPQDKVEHTEYWSLSKICPELNDDSIDRILLPQIAAMNKSTYYVK